jgi:hypothetical protein
MVRHHALLQQDVRRPQRRRRPPVLVLEQQREVVHQFAPAQLRHLAFVLQAQPVGIDHVVVHIRAHADFFTSK